MLILDNQDMTLKVHNLRVFILREDRLCSHLGILPRDSAHSFEQLLFFIHECVCTFKSIMEALYGSKIELAGECWDEHDSNNVVYCEERNYLKEK